MIDKSVTRDAFMIELTSRRFLIETGVAGVYGRGAAFLKVVAGIERRIDAACRSDLPEKVFFPAVIPREILRRTGYMENFPDLCGSVHAFCGTPTDHPALVETVVAEKDWTPHLSMTDLVLAPAGCYPVYPTQAGILPLGGKIFDLTASCYRHEPSKDPARLQAFQLRENVRLGLPADVMAWRMLWMERVPSLFDDLGFEFRLDTASDPFFGRGGRMMKAAQKEQELKFELLVPIWPDHEPTAVASFNYHGSHFGHIFGIQTQDGSDAHTACVGFGLERIALALLKRHGFDLDAWPAQVRSSLWS
jgi:seryl-tRNA synthetase